ncbi:MAG: hypothetical protein ACK5MN_02840 [Lachnospiraceae bacterium]
MKIGIVDADLLYRSRHRFPNRARMKLSGFYKEQGEAVEHHKPDYGLYQPFAEAQQRRRKSTYKFYTEYSIGFLSRGCFRRCGFCINKNSFKSEPASPLEEFLDKDRKKLCFLDDNFLACDKWEELLDAVLETEKAFQFRQGLDLRIMKKEQMKKLFGGKQDGKMIFAFDDIRDRKGITGKLELLFDTVGPVAKALKFYVLCGFDRQGKWDHTFWEKDISDTLERIRILMDYGCLAYVMRYMRWERAPAPYRGMYISISRWCNQPVQYTQKSLREFCQGQGTGSSSFCYLHEFEQIHPKLTGYLDMKYEGEGHGKIHG